MSTATTPPAAPPPNPLQWARYMWANRPRRRRQQNGQPSRKTESSKLSIRRLVAYVAVVALTAYVWDNGLFSVWAAVAGVIVGLVAVAILVMAKKLRGQISGSNSGATKWVMLVIGVVIGVVMTLAVLYLGSLALGVALTGFTLTQIFSFAEGLVVVLVGNRLGRVTRVGVPIAPPAPATPPSSPATATSPSTP